MQKFTTKKGKKIIIRPPTKTDSGNMTSFFNRLIEEDTYIIRNADLVTVGQEEKWLRGVLARIEKKKTVFLQAYFNDRLVGQVEINKNDYRKKYVGTLHLAVDKDFRGEGIGEELIKLAEEEVKKLGVTIIDLTAIDGNSPAISLYKKLGYIEFGRLPESVDFKGKMLDEVYMYKKLY